MDYTIYEFSLFIALPLMLFFGFYFLEAHFQKVLKRQKSANSTKMYLFDNLKSAQTTILIER